MQECNKATMGPLSAVHLQTTVLGLKYGKWGQEKYGTKPTKVDALEWFRCGCTGVRMMKVVWWVCGRVGAWGVGCGWGGWRLHCGHEPPGGVVVQSLFGIGREPVLEGGGNLLGPGADGRGRPGVTKPGQV